MKRDKSLKFHVRIFVFSLVLYAYCFSPAEVSGYQNHLKDLRVYKNSDELRIVIDFSYPLKTEPNFSAYEKSIQFDMSDVYIHPSKRVFDINDELLKHIYALQHSKDSVRMRLVLTQNGLRLKERLSVLKDKKNLIISIKKGSEGQVINIPPSVESKTGDIQNKTEKSEVSRMESSVKTENPTHNMGSGGGGTEFDITKDQTFLYGIQPQIHPLLPIVQDITPKLTVSKQDPGQKNTTLDTMKEQTKPGSSYLKYQEAVPISPPDTSSVIMKTIAALGIVIAVVLIISYVAKKYLKKNDIVFGRDKIIRVLGTSYIGVKKAITLLDVAGELLVIGVSHNNITMLTKLECEEAKNKIKSSRHTFKSIPNSESGSGWDSELSGIPISGIRDRKTLSTPPETCFPVKEEMLAQITKTIQEKVRKLKRIE
ncbi:MAG: flagellar biosynthetic protein FliO [Nitrospinota bacterium]